MSAIETARDWLRCVAILTALLSGVALLAVPDDQVHAAATSALRES